MRQAAFLLAITLGAIWMCNHGSQSANGANAAQEREAVSVFAPDPVP